MDKKTLEAKLSEAQQRFDELTKQKADIDSELLRLQGDYRTVKDFIDNLEEKGEKKDATSTGSRSAQSATS